VAGDRACIEDESKMVGLGAFDLAIEAVGSSQALEDALALVRPGGLVANYGVAAENDPETEAIRAARQAGRIINLPVHEEEVHGEFLEFVARGEVHLGDWISHRLPLSEIHEGLRLLKEKQAIKVVIDLW